MYCSVGLRWCGSAFKHPGPLQDPFRHHNMAPKQLNISQMFGFGNRRQREVGVVQRKTGYNREYESWTVENFGKLACAQEVGANGLHDFLTKQASLRGFSGHHAMKNGFILKWIQQFDAMLHEDDRKEERSPLATLVQRAKKKAEEQPAVVDPPSAPAALVQPPPLETLPVIVDVEAELAEAEKDEAAEAALRKSVAERRKRKRGEMTSDRSMYDGDPLYPDMLRDEVRRHAALKITHEVVQPSAPSFPTEDELAVIPEA